MYITTRFIGTQRGNMNYLFYLLTEDYIESQSRIMEALEPLLIKLSVDLGQAGALVRPFKNYESATLVDILGKEWPDGEQGQLSITPGILIIDKDFDSFDPRQDKWLHISLRELISSNSDVQIFELSNLFTHLIEASREGILLDIPKSKLGRSPGKRLLETIEIKPGAFGMSIDLKQAFRILSGLKKKNA